MKSMVGRTPYGYIETVQRERGARLRSDLARRLDGEFLLGRWQEVLAVGRLCWLEGGHGQRRDRSRVVVIFGPKGPCR